MTEEQSVCVTLVNIVRLIVIRDLGEGLQITASNEGNVSQSPGAQIARIFICLQIVIFQ